MLDLYGHCPNSLRLTPPSVKQPNVGGKVHQTILASPYTPGQTWKKILQIILASLHPSNPFRAMPMWKQQHISKRGFPYEGDQKDQLLNNQINIINFLSRWSRWIRSKWSTFDQSDKDDQHLINQIKMINIWSIRSRWSTSYQDDQDDQVLIN